MRGGRLWPPCTLSDAIAVRGAVTGDDAAMPDAEVANEEAAAAAADAGGDNQ